jgi:hypothetical protein
MKGFEEKFLKIIITFNCLRLLIQLQKYFKILQLAGRAGKFMKILKVKTTYWTVFRNGYLKKKR